jgi:predicted permease
MNPLEREIAYHIDRVTQDYIAQGIDPQEARRRALLEFGGAAQIHEDLRDIHRMRWLADLRQDLIYAARTLRRSPGFLASAVLTLALGIGANTAIFSLIDAVMLRPMPAVRAPEQLVEIAVSNRDYPDSISYPMFEVFRGRLSTVSGLFVEMPVRHTITVDGVDEDANGDEVSGAYYSVLGLAPAAGRLLDPADDAAPTPVAVISYEYWRRRFGLDPAAIGKQITYATSTLTIVGVEPEGFEGTERGRTREFTVPFSMTGQLGGGDGSWRQEWDRKFLVSMARLKPGVTPARAAAEIKAVFAGWLAGKAASLLPADRNQWMKQRATALPAAAGTNSLRFHFGKPLGILMGIVALVLLLASANLSGLLLARAAARQREISVRRALGAGNGRLTRQFLAESLLLAVCGALAGLAVAQWFCRALIRMMANGDDLVLRVSPDWRIFAFTGAVSLLACLFAGLAPGLSARSVNLNPALKRGRNGGHQSLGRLLMVAQLAISMTLLVGASLFIRTLLKLYSVDTGVHADGIFIFSVISKHHFPEARSVEIENAILERIQSLPGVVFSSAANMLPIGSGLWTRRVQVEGYTFRAAEDDTAAINAIAPKYFAVTGTPLLLGRDFTLRDEARAAPAAIVNETFVRELFGGRDPLGRHVTSNNVTYEVVGVAKDAKYEGLRKGVPRTMYIPWVQQGNIDWSNRSQPMGYDYIARVAGGDPMRLALLVERAIPQIDAAMRMRSPQTFEDHINQSILNERMMATLGGFFGLLALLVAGLGIFGVMAFQVSRRVNEIGVRMALGATRASIVRLVLREVPTLLLPGCAVGALAAAGLSRFANSFLFGVTPTDPLAFAIAAGALASATLAASYLPALRAARVDPMAALRCD